MVEHVILFNILFNKKDVWDGICDILQESPYITHLRYICEKYQFIQKVLTYSEFDDNTLTMLHDDFGIHSLTFYDFVDEYKHYCKEWAVTVTKTVPHMTLSNYVHYVVHHSHELLLRDGSIGLHSADGIEKCHQKSKMDIRRHLGRGSWCRTLLLRWLMRSDVSLK